MSTSMVPSVESSQSSGSSSCQGCQPAEPAMGVADSASNIDSCTAPWSNGRLDRSRHGFVLLGAPLSTQRVAPLLGDLGGTHAQPRVVGDEQPRPLVADTRHPAHEPADRLAEEQLGGRRRWRTRRPAAAGCRRPPRPSARRRATASRARRRSGRCASDAVRVVRGHHHGRDPEPAPEQLGDAAGVLLVDGDDQAAGVRLVPPDVGQPVDAPRAAPTAATRRRATARCAAAGWRASWSRGSSKVAS